MTALNLKAQFEVPLSTFKMGIAGFAVIEVALFVILSIGFANKISTPQMGKLTTATCIIGLLAVPILHIGITQTKDVYQLLESKVSMQIGKFIVPTRNDIKEDPIGAKKIAYKTNLENLLNKTEYLIHLFTVMIITSLVLGILNTTKVLTPQQVASGLLGINLSYLLLTTLGSLHLGRQMIKLKNEIFTQITQFDQLQ